jgi:hypothetical protein
MFREVRVFEVREVLRLWLRGEGLRAVEGFELGASAQPNASVSRGATPAVQSRWGERINSTLT